MVAEVANHLVSCKFFVYFRGWYACWWRDKAIKYPVWDIVVNFPPGTRLSE